MKKKLLAGVLAAVGASALIASLAACTAEDAHSFSEEWSNNASKHWHACLDDECDAKDGEASHSWDGGTVKSAPDCTADGKSEFTCTVCGYEMEVTVNALGHAWGEWEITKPQANEKGSASHTCTRTGCGESEDKELPELSSKNSYTLTKNTATCEDGGTATYTLASDKTISFTAGSEALGHSYYGYGYAGAEGHYQICARNADHKTAVVPHNMGEIIQSDGQMVSTCADCGYEEFYQSTLNTTLASTVMLQPVNGVSSVNLWLDYMDGVDIVHPAYLSVAPQEAMTLKLSVPKSAGAVIVFGTTAAKNSQTAVNGIEPIDISSNRQDDDEDFVSADLEEGNTYYICISKEGDKGAGFALKMTAHMHEYAQEWSTDAGYHWHANTCHTEMNIQSNKAQHTFEDGECSVCHRAFPSATASLAYSFDDATHTASVTGVGAEETAVVIPETVTEGGQEYTVTAIAENAFKSNTAIASITVPQTVTEIGADAFSGCTALTSLYIFDADAWAEINFAGKTSNPFNNSKVKTGVTYLNFVPVVDLELNLTAQGVSAYAFLKSTSIESVTLKLASGVQASDVTVGASAFEGCNIRKLYVDSLDEYLAIDFSAANAHPLASAFNARLYVDGEPVENLSLSGLEKIPAYAFANCIFDSVSFTGVNEIGGYAFKGATIGNDELDLTSVSELGNNAFASAKINKVNLGGVGIIGAYAFNGSTVTEISGQNITEIGTYAFYGCYSLTKAELEGTYTTLDSQTFGACSKLTSFVIPDSVTELTATVFSGCAKLSSVKLGANVQTIGQNTFYNCLALSIITLPASIKKIDRGSFQGAGLTAFVIEKTDAENLTLTSLFGTGTNANIYKAKITALYFKGTEEEWTANGNAVKSKWQTATNTTATVYFYSETQPSAEGNFWHDIGGVPTVWGA